MLIYCLLFLTNNNFPVFIIIILDIWGGVLHSLTWIIGRNHTPQRDIIVGYFSSEIRLTFHKVFFLLEPTGSTGRSWGILMGEILCLVFPIPLYVDVLKDHYRQIKLSYSMYVQLYSVWSIVFQTQKGRTRAFSL